MTHENADFDAVASQLAAHRLFPEGVPLLPRRINRNVNQFLTLYWDALPFLRPDDWQKRRVESILIVDTHSLNSVRGVVRKPSVKVIDHHATEHRRAGWSYHVEAVGATTTILVEMLQAAGLSLIPEEATLLLLGIYEDTGALTYATTTSRDARAAAALLDSGALLTVVRRFLNVALTPEQRDLYDALQREAEWIEIEGHSVVLAAAQAPEDFGEEISSVAHRLRDVFSAAALIVLVGLNHDVQMVARSTDSYVDVSVIARALGGGGHDRAAAAMVTGRSLDSVKEAVITALPSAIRPLAHVAQIMSFGVQTISHHTTVEEASRMMQRLGYEGYPVIDEVEDRLVGLLTRRAVDRAMSHDLGALPVNRIMKAGSVMVRPSDSVERLQQIMLDEGWGQVPVMSDEPAPAGSCQPIGIVTRTDLLNYLFQPVPQTAQPDMRQLLEESFSDSLWKMLLVISEAADELRMPLYFVGGVVRDLLLRYPATDFDMVVEGDAIKLVRRLQDRFGGDVHTHDRFGTAKWFVSPDVWRSVAPDAAPADVPETIDLVTARTEFYTEPSALPEVERGSIKLDLHRRDFTINTLAVRLDGHHLGELLDFYGGRRDLEQGIVRVLHSLSFVDDPTRILRAVRLEQRLGFRIEPRSAELMANALPMLDRVSGSRIRHEIEIALREPSPERTIERLSELGVMEHIHPGLRWHDEAAKVFGRVPALYEHPVWQALMGRTSLPFIYFALWIAPLPAGVQNEVMERLKVRKLTREDVAAVTRLLAGVERLPADAAPSRWVKVLGPHRPRVLLVARALLGEGKGAEQIDRFYGEWSQVKTSISGDDLRQLGIKPGPVYAEILEKLLAARLDGHVIDDAGERALLEETIRQMDLPET